MTGLERYIKKMRLAIVLEEMDQVVPWEKLCWLIEPCYPSWPMDAAERTGADAADLQQWFKLTDPAAEQAVYDSAGLHGRSAGAIGEWS